MSRTDKFLNKYIGKKVDVEPGWGYPGECVSLVQRFIIEEIGAKAKARGNGADWTHSLINEGLGYRVTTPQKGDVIAWKSKNHVAICLGGDAIFEQIGPSVKGTGIAQRGKISSYPNDGLITRLNDFVDNDGKDHADKTDEQLATEVWQGKHGNGDARKASLGTRYDAVQTLVEKGVGKPNPAPSKDHANKTDEQLAKEVWAGKHGNGEARKKSLGNRYTTVQALVEKGVGKPAPSNPKPTLNKHGQAVVVGQKIQFSYLYGTPNFSDKPLNEKTMYFTEKRGTKTVGYGWVEAITENGYRVKSASGSTIGFVRPVNTY